LNYDDLPGILPDLFRFLNFPDRGEWDQGISSMDIVADGCSWLTQVTGEFKNTDVEKRSRLDPATKKSVYRALALTRPFRPIIAPLRAAFDRRSLNHVYMFAREKLRLADHSS
jgi:hypothetical protein